MSDKHYQTIVEGEASESSSNTGDEHENSDFADDSDRSDVAGSMMSMTGFQKNIPSSVVVEGEASESDEEELDSTGGRMKQEISPLKVTKMSTSHESVDGETNVPVSVSHKQIGKPKFDTVLNRKLWERNLSLCINLNGAVSQAYLSAAKDISNCGHQLSKSHTVMQDVSHNMRLLTNDLLNLEDRIDTITTCKLLPSIQLSSASLSGSDNTKSSEISAS